MWLGTLQGELGLKSSAQCKGSPQVQQQWKEVEAELSAEQRSPHPMPPSSPDLPYHPSERMRIPRGGGRARSLYATPPPRGGVAFVFLVGFIVDLVPLALESRDANYVWIRLRQQETEQRLHRLVALVFRVLVVHFPDLAVQVEHKENVHACYRVWSG